MPTMIVLFNLRDGVDEAIDEEWARSVDVPAVGRLRSIDSFRVLRSSGVLGSDAAAPYRYVEIVEVNDMGVLGEDVASEEMGRVAAAFQSLAL